jgi:hypothetical protein
MKREIIPWNEMATYGKIMGWLHQSVRNVFDLPPGFNIAEFMGTGDHFVDALTLHFELERDKEIEKLEEAEYERAEARRR